MIKQFELGKRVWFRAQHIYLFHIVVIYENDLICIFVNINESLKMRKKPLKELVPHGVIDLH